MSANLTFRLRHNLAILLKERGITASQLARKTGVAKQVLSDWMSGVQPRKIEQLHVIACELGVTMETLCFSKSDEELLARIGHAKNSPAAPSGSAAGVFGGANGAGGEDVFSPDEIRGRFEIYLRRI